tara:strand:- start:271 stop:1635 length:1365 start_codon:yes stop_codon:yes gene_type:complete
VDVTRKAPQGKDARHKPYKPIERGRTTVVFDLDDTLMEANGLGTHTYDGEVNDKYKASPQTYPTHSLLSDVLVDKVINHDGKTKKGIEEVSVLNIHFRPYVIDLLKYCFEHFNVAFWSSAPTHYVRKIVQRLTRLCGKTEADICFAWGRDVYRRPRFADVFTGAPIKERPSEKENTDFRKPMYQVWDTYPSVDRNHLILFDNLPSHMVANERENHVYIPPFSYMNANDTILREILDIIQKKVESQNGKGGKGKRAQITSSDLRAIESVSPLNKRKSMSQPYLRLNTGFTRPDISTLPKGEEVAVFYPEADKVLPSIICKKPKEGDNYAWVEVHHAKRHSNHGMNELSETIDPKTLVRSGVVTRERRRVPIHMVLGPLSLVAEAYGLKNEIENWRLFSGRKLVKDAHGKNEKKTQSQKGKKSQKSPKVKQSARKSTWSRRKTRRSARRTRRKRGK